MFAHPNPNSFSAHLANRVRAGLASGGHDHRTIDLHAEGFRAAMSEEEWLLHRAPSTRKPWVTSHADHLGWADAIVWVYPTWWSGPPAILKGWVDRVWTNGTAYDHTDTGLHPGPLTHIRRMYVVTTHGSSRLVNLAEGEVGRKLIRRTLRALCGWRCRTTWMALYGIDRSKADDRARFADAIERCFARL